MKTVGLCFLLLTFILGPVTFAQSQPANSTTDTLFAPSDDDVIAQLWKVHATQPDKPYLDGDKLIISSDESDSNTCLYLRVYRMKREAKKSDVTIPSGYTTCVRANRFEKKSAAEPKQH